jgi:hypothetical protein
VEQFLSAVRVGRDSEQECCRQGRDAGFVALNTVGTPHDIGVQVFSFAPTTASFVRLNILDTWSSSSFSVAFNEVALRASLVPEPGILSLFGLGFLCLLAANRARYQALKNY